MTPKQQVGQILESLPENSSYQEIMKGLFSEKMKYLELKENVATKLTTSDH